MKKIMHLIAIAALGFGIATAQAEMNVKNDMRALAQALKSAEGAKTAPELKSSLDELNKVAKQSMEQAKAAKTQGEMEKTYIDGMQKLAAATDKAAALAAAGKLDEARAALEQIKAVRNEFHKKMR